MTCASRGAEQGDEAFERHQLLAIRFHRVARLNQRASGKEGQAWCLYFDEHLPRSDKHALLLWEEWRVKLLKDETPGAGVVITHGQPTPLVVQGFWPSVKLGAPATA